MRVADVDIPLEKAASLARLITDEDDREIVDTLRTMMKTATLTVRAPRCEVDKNGRLQNDYAEIPDWRARGWAAVKLAEIKHGRPRQQVDVKVSGSVRRPLTNAEAIRELMEDAEDIRRIFDEHVRLIKQAVPANGDGIQPQLASTQIVDVDLPADTEEK